MRFLLLLSTKSTIFILYLRQIRILYRHIDKGRHRWECKNAFSMICYAHPIFAGSLGNQHWCNLRESFSSFDDTFPSTDHPRIKLKNKSFMLLAKKLYFATCISEILRLQIHSVWKSFKKNLICQHGELSQKWKKKSSNWSEISNA